MTLLIPAWWNVKLTKITTKNVPNSGNSPEDKKNALNEAKPMMMYIMVKMPLVFAIGKSLLSTKPMIHFMVKIPLIFAREKTL